MASPTYSRGSARSSTPKPKKYSRPSPKRTPDRGFPGETSGPRTTLPKKTSRVKRVIPASRRAF